MSPRSSAQGGMKMAMGSSRDYGGERSAVFRLPLLPGCEFHQPQVLLGELHEHQSSELLLRAEIQKPQEVLRSATEINAKIIGLPDKLGTVRAGAYADLIALKGDPLRDLGLLQDQGAHLDLIMKAGVVVKRAL